MDHDSGIIEFISDATTIDSLKQNLINLKIEPTLKNFFCNFFSDKEIEEAKKNFCRSLAAYSLACYIL
jgi:phosphatidylinositol kinase/protein kinase (PI-3  family)